MYIKPLGSSWTNFIVFIICFRVQNGFSNIVTPSNTLILLFRVSKFFRELLKDG